MARIMQFRYYGDKDSQNQPSGLTANRLYGGSCFNAYYPITKLGIQSLPGTEFYLNNSDYSISLGTTGIYEIDLTGKAEITSIRFAPESLQRIRNISGASLIIDFAYEGGNQ